MKLEMWGYRRTCIVMCLLALLLEQVYSDCVNPTESWPLMKTTCGVPSSRLQNTSSLCGGLNGQFDSTGGIIPLSFSGSHNSYLDVAVTTTTGEIPDDFGFSAYIRPSDLNGTILHYQAADISPSSTDETTELKLKLVNGKLTVTRKFRSNLDEEIITDTESGLLMTDQWQMVAFLHDLSGGKAAFFLNGIESSKQGPATLYKNFRFSGPGTLRVGSTMDGTDPGFAGVVTCVQFHANKDKIFDNDTCMAYCKNIPNARLSFDKRQYGRFTLIGREVEPTDGHMTGGLVTTETWTDCGLRCLRDLAECVSFTAEPLTNGLYNCIMYDYIQFVDLVYASNKFYYRLQDYD